MAVPLQARRALAFAPRALRLRLNRRASSAAVTELVSLSESGHPVIAGPWLSEVGFELLYWLPLLAWLRDEHGLEPQNVVAVSRGGAGGWYGNVAGRTAEVLDFVDAETIATWRERRARSGSEKQSERNAHEKAFVDDVAHCLAMDNASWLPPSLMYRLFNVAWEFDATPAVPFSKLRFEPLPQTANPTPIPDLPPSYVAVKAYFSRCFPDSPENRRFLTDTVARLAGDRPVVLLRSGLNIDDHVEPVIHLDGVVDAAPLLDPGRNLEQQTEIVRGASLLVATYGGFSYLGPFVGVPTASFYSTPWFNPKHVEVMRIALRALGAPGHHDPIPVDAFAKEALDR